MKAIEIEIKYSLRDYYRVVVERASSKIQMRTSKLVSGRKQWLWLLGSVPFVIVGFWAWKAGFVWTGWGFNFVALFVALNWVITTEWGYGNIMPLIACLIAICVRKLQPTYHFKIDETGIRRVAGTHEYFVPWQEVVQIHQYPSTFLIELQKGAMPILYRVLSKDQREGLNLAFQKYRSTANPIIAK